MADSPCEIARKLEDMSRRYYAKAIGTEKMLQRGFNHVSLQDVTNNNITGDLFRDAAALIRQQQEPKP